MVLLKMAHGSAGFVWCRRAPGTERVPVSGSSHPLAVVELGLVSWAPLLALDQGIAVWPVVVPGLSQGEAEAREVFLSLESLPVDPGCCWCWERDKRWCQCRWVWPFIPNWLASFSPPQPRAFCRRGETLPTQAWLRRSLQADPNLTTSTRGQTCIMCPISSFPGLEVSPGLRL